jgi:hypothetical protein
MRPLLALSVALFTLLLSDGTVGPAQAQNAPPRAILQLGDAAVTGFSGVTALRPPPGGVPADYFYINQDGASFVVFDLSRMQGPEDARLVNAPRKFSVQAKQIGQVFGVTLDDGTAPGTRAGTRNIYVTATSMFGLDIVAPGQGAPRRLKTGAANAQWMAGQFGLGLRGGPGSIWKVDGSGNVTLFVNVAYQGAPNSGPALGNITFDPVSKHLFVSDLETGMIHRFDLNRRELAVFDHGMRGRPRQRFAAVPFNPAQRVGIAKPTFNANDPASWGYAAPSRRVFGPRSTAAASTTRWSKGRRSGRSASMPTAALPTTRGSKSTS